MKKCEKKVLPIFNRMVIFSTTDFSYHGNPNKVKVEENNSRKSTRDHHTHGSTVISTRII